MRIHVKVSDVMTQVLTVDEAMDVAYWMTRKRMLGVAPAIVVLNQFFDEVKLA